MGTATDGSLDGIGAVTSVVQDAQGFMWFGGESGLAKYDGHNFKVYRHNGLESLSLSNSYVRDMLVDHSGGLWVATQGGLNFYDPVTDSFQRSKHGNADLGLPLATIPVNELYESARRVLYVSTDRGLFLLDSSRAILEEFAPNPQIQKLLSSFGVHHVIEDSRRNLWIGTRGAGLIRYNLDSKTLERFVHSSDNKLGLAHNVVNSISEDRAGNIWVAFLNGALQKISNDQVGFKNYFSSSNSKKDGSPNSVWELVVDSRGTLWVATDGVGLGRYDAQLDKIILNTHSAFDPYSLMHTTVNGLHEDTNGDLWVGTFPEGISFWNRSSSSVEAYYHEANNTKSLNHSAVLCFFKDSDGVLWVGTEGGLNRFDPVSREFKRYSGDENSLFPENAVLSVVEDKNNDLWFGTWSAGVYKYNKETGSVRQYFPDNSVSGSIGSEFVWQLLSDKNGDLWAATETSGLNRYDFETDTFTSFLTESSSGQGNNVEFIWPIFEDSYGDFWAGLEVGVALFDREALKFSSPELSVRSLLSQTRVSAIFEDSRGILWFASHNNGLIGINRKDNSSYHYTIVDGLPSNALTGLIEDNEGHLWINTMNGAAKFNILNRTFTKYDESDGIISMHLNRNAMYVDEGGKLFIGGSKGISAFQPSVLTLNTLEPKVVLTDFKIFHKSVVIGAKDSPIKKHINYTDHIELESSQSAFTIEFAALSYRSSKENDYKYQLVGFDHDWVDSPSNNLATYTNLDPGEYVFKVMGANNDGVWGEREQVLTIRVRPPFSKSPVAYMLYMFIFCLFVYLLYSIQKRRVALHHQKEINRHLMKFNQLKNDFIANASHELKTPLNGIIGMAESLVGEKEIQESSPNVKSNINNIVHSGRRLSSLIGDILDFSKISENKLNLELSSINLPDLVRDVITTVEPHLDSKPIELVVHVPNTLPEVQADNIRLKQILNNLLDNAIKFTERGTIKLYAKVELDNVVIQVSDSGIGIDDEQRQFIFEHFTQGDGSLTRRRGGIGLGLAIVDFLVKQHGGKLELISEKNQGSTFSFSLPVSKSNRILSIASKKRTQSLEPEKQSSPRMLVVDDDPVNRMVLVTLLSQQGYEVDEAEGGSSALELIEMNPSYDILILDVMMPVMSGFELARHIRRKSTKDELPIIFLSAMDQEEDIAEGYRVGGNEYLGKPLIKERLLDSIRSLVEAKLKVTKSEVKKGL